MKQASLAKWLKAIIGGTGLCGIIVYVVLIFDIMKDLVAAHPEFASWYTPWVVFLLLTGLPCCAILVLGWRIAVHIGEDRFFILENAAHFHSISKLAAGDAAFFFAGNIVLWLCGRNHPAILLASVFVAFVAVVVAVVMAVLSHLVRKGAGLQDQSDFTI